MTLNYNAFVVSKDLGWKSTGNEWYVYLKNEGGMFLLVLKVNEMVVLVIVTFAYSVVNSTWSW